MELNTLITLIEAHVGKSAKIRNLPVQPGDVPITHADVSKAKRLLGYDPKVSLEEGIESFVRWYADQRSQD